jgi:hypothetical protein
LHIPVGDAQPVDIGRIGWHSIASPAPWGEMLPLFYFVATNESNEMLLGIESAIVCFSLIVLVSF